MYSIIIHGVEISGFISEEAAGEASKKIEILLNPVITPEDAALAIVFDIRVNDVAVAKEVSELTETNFFADLQRASEEFRKKRRQSN